MKKTLPKIYLDALAAAVDFDLKREELSKGCRLERENGMTLNQIAVSLNEKGVLTKSGKKWSAANVHHLLANPEPPPVKEKSKQALKREKRESTKKGVRKDNDLGLTWAALKYPKLELWRELCSEWLSRKETGLSVAVQAMNVFLEFVAKYGLPSEPTEFMLNRTYIPELYESIWGKVRTHGKVHTHNNVHLFLEWVLTQRQFCEEDDNGCLQISSAFRNPVPQLTRSGLPRPVESVRGTLPYGYIEELRRMIAQGPNFNDWKWAQQALGSGPRTGARKGRKSGETTVEPDSSEMLSPVWFQVDKENIDKSDPDCVWRRRTRFVPSDLGLRGGGKKKETIFEMWSPVRWVALLVKLQLPLRTMQVRMLDSGEADTWIWERGGWSLNTSDLARGSEARPYANGVFFKANELTDEGAKVLLHINTNKTADREKVGTKKGYNVPWMQEGELHQDPFYWLEKLRRWQGKYNPINKLTSWMELDGRHIPTKSEVQLAGYPDTAFLFRTPEIVDHPHFPLTITAMNPPWYACLATLQGRLYERGERISNGTKIRLVQEWNGSKRNSNVTFFPLHCLRVSLITALALDGEVPLAILQKIAGHSRLVMTLYYTKPGATHIREAIQAGVERLNEASGDSIVEWLAKTEYVQLVSDVIANSLESFKAAVPELADTRSPAGWMVMLDGLCLVGGNSTEVDIPGCHNGGPNIGNETSPRHAPVPGGARNCPRCRWFVTRPLFIPQLAARWNNVSYHCADAKEQIVKAELRLREIEDRRAAALIKQEIFLEQRQYAEAQRTREQAIKFFEDLALTLAAITKLLERCKAALHVGDGTQVIAGGGSCEFEYVINETDSELLQLSGVCVGTEFYPDLSPGKAVLRQSQILDSALVRDNLPPMFLMLSETEQQLIGNAFLKCLAAQMNPQNPALGRYQAISIMDAGGSLRARLGPSLEELFKVSKAQVTSASIIPIAKLTLPRG